MILPFFLEKVVSRVVSNLLVDGVFSRHVGRLVFCFLFYVPLEVVLEDRAQPFMDQKASGEILILVGGDRALSFIEQKRA